MIEEYHELQKIVGNVLDAPGKGGNISVKEDNRMLIKSSGEDMKNPRHLFSEVVNDSWDIKPSMEYKMHKVLNYRLVAHYHPVYVLPYLCSNYEFDIGETIDYVNPGDDLAEQVAKTKSKIIFLRNHGVIICGDTIQEIKELHGIIKNKFLEFDNDSFTPDDVVDCASEELWLFRQYIKFKASKLGLTLNTISDENINKLTNDENEKYRKERM